MTGLILRWNAYEEVGRLRPDVRRDNAACGRANPAPAQLTIAGSDSGGGAGTRPIFKRYGIRRLRRLAITAITAQNTVGVARHS